MAELVREIDVKDIPKLKQLMALIFGDSYYKEIKRLGGMTNRSYKITRADDQEYLVRIPGEGTEEMINRSDERKSTDLACRLGIDSELLYFGDDGCKVMRFISNPQSMSGSILQKSDILTQAADIFRRLHTCGEDTGVKFEVFEMAYLYEHIIYESGVSIYDDYKGVKQSVMKIKSSVDADNIVGRVPCHNDSLVDNWVLDENGRLYLIDWEYSGMNEPMWDLSCLSIEAGFSEESDDALLEAYFQRRTTSNEKKYFVAAKIYVDYLWTLWGLTRVPFDGTFMQEYADARYMRLKNNIAYYKTIE